MSKFHLREVALLGVAGIAMSAVAPSTAVAQTTTSATSEAAAQPLEEAVVTGTLIRDIAPVGANLLTLSPGAIEVTGAEDTNQLLGSLPQNVSFNNLDWEQPAGGASAFNTRIPIARPNLRNLPGCGGAGSGSCELILIDGHRVVPEGIQETAVDPDVVPLGIIDHVEIVLDGASALYGSDAVGGVMNFITKKNFDGVQFDAHYGHADGYNTEDASLTAGRSWDSGSLVFTYSFGDHDAALNSMRNVQSIDWATGVPTGRDCVEPNVVIPATGVSYAEPGLAANTFNSCDYSGLSAFYPSDERHGGFLTFTQDVTDHIKFDVEAFYSYNNEVDYSGPFGGSTSIKSTNPYYQKIPGVAGTPTETVEFSYIPIFGNEPATEQTLIQAGQVTPTLTVTVGNWQIRTLYSWGESSSAYNNNSLNTSLQSLFIGGPTGSAAAIPQSAAIDPYNLTATTNQALFGGLQYQNRGEGVNEFYDVRSAADGKLFSMPGGDVHAALGVERYNDSFKTNITNTTTTLLGPYTVVSQYADAVFGELYVPIVGKGNSLPGIEGLSLDASGRYDNYEAVGGRFDPKLSLNYNPVQWITVRGNWGESFNAPTPADKVGSANNLIILVPIANAATAAAVIPSKDIPLLPPGLNAALFISGTNPNLKPQTSTNWAIGGDIKPPVVPHLTLSGTYYNIYENNIIQLPTPTGNMQYQFNNYPQTYEFLPTQAEINTYIAQAPSSGQAALASAVAGGYNLANLIDGRTINAGLVKLSGIDFSVSYNLPTTFGSIDASWAGNRQLKRDSEPYRGAPINNDLYQLGYAPTNFSTNVGATVGKFRAQMTWNFTSGYSFLPAAGVNLQSKVNSFDAFNLFFRYNVDGPGLAKDLALTLSIENVTNALPPFNKTTTGGEYAGDISILGRLTQFGVSKKF